MNHALSRPKQEHFVATGVRDAWDALLIVTIFAGLGVLGWMALGTTLLRPLLDLAERQQWSSLWVRPT
ncbi:MAG TPA: hypothetical protein VN747_04080, partial [Burkholderiales bacterium]|nr:hypothetical protein [Burkholderiales bacterium]